MKFVFHKKVSIWRKMWKTIGFGNIPETCELIGSLAEWRIESKTPKQTATGIMHLCTQNAILDSFVQERTNENWLIMNVDLVYQSPKKYLLHIISEQFCPKIFKSCVILSFFYQTSSSVCTWTVSLYVCRVRGDRAAIGQIHVMCVFSVYIHDTH